MGDGDALTAAIGEAADALGGLTGLFNNAGIGNLKSLADYTDREFDLIMRVNLFGTFAGIRAAVPLLLAGGGGSIVNMASVSGVKPTRGEGPYSAAKAGVIALTMSAALEYGPDIRVNCVSPGFVRTPLNQMIADDPVHARDDRGGHAARPVRRPGGGRVGGGVPAVRRRLLPHRPEPGDRRRLGARVPTGRHGAGLAAGHLRRPDRA